MTTGAVADCKFGPALCSITSGRSPTRICGRDPVSSRPMGQRAGSTVAPPARSASTIWPGARFVPTSSNSPCAAPPAEGKDLVGEMNVADFQAKRARVVAAVQSVVQFDGVFAIGRERRHQARVAGNRRVHLSPGKLSVPCVEQMHDRVELAAEAMTFDVDHDALARLAVERRAQDRPARERAIERDGECARFGGEWALGQMIDTDEHSI